MSSDAMVSASQNLKISNTTTFFQNKATALQIFEHISKCDNSFTPPLRDRVNIHDYAHKISIKTERFEAWIGNELIGLVASYFNDKKNRTAFITTVSILPQWQNCGLASRLMTRCIRYAQLKKFTQIKLEVNKNNYPAIKLYKKHGFSFEKTEPHSSTMQLPIDNTMQTQRNYNSEIKDTRDRQYAYSFDFDVMHPYMIRSFKPFFKQGNLLELGSFKGDFTLHLLDHFRDITCVDASDDAILVAKSRLENRVQFIKSTFETAALPTRYENIILTHALEHIDNPIGVLQRINSEWLSEGGRLFLACPNANAPSRQIAVKMGLISHNAAVTDAEARHGHRRTYSLDTLERDATAAGLNVIHRSGIFFKALANFQWDRLLKTDIISKEYLDGCYTLGQHYPDLCSSIYLICEATPNINRINFKNTANS